MSWDVNKQMLAAIVRWLLVGLAAIFVRHGIVDEATADAWLSETTSILVGLVILAIPLVWKFLNARFNILALIKAVQTEPPADTPREINAAVAEAQQAATDDKTVTTISA